MAAPAVLSDLAQVLKRGTSSRRVGGSVQFFERAQRP